MAKENCSGLTIDDRKIRVDYSITQRAHTPTPGVYMGKPTRAYRDKDYERSDRGSRYNSRDEYGLPAFVLMLLCINMCTFLVLVTTIMRKDIVTDDHHRHTIAEGAAVDMTAADPDLTLPETVSFCIRLLI